MEQTAGAKLRTRLDDGLKARGPGWEWSEYDAEVIESAVRHADRAEQLQRAYDRELARESPSTATLTRLAAEVRHQERRVIELVAMVTPAAEVPKSKRHQAAVNARWDRKREREAARVIPMHGS